MMGTLIILLSSILLLGFGPPKYNVQATLDSEYFSGGSKVDSTLGLRVSVPQGWAAIIDDPYASNSINHCETYCLLFFQKEDSRCSDATGDCKILFPIEIVVATSIDGKVVDEDDIALKTLASQYKKLLPGFEMEDEGRIDINGKDAYYLSGSVGLNVKHLYIFIPENDRIYTFHFGGNTQRYDEALAFFESIVMSAEFLDSDSFDQSSNSGNPFGNNAGTDNSLGQTSNSGNPLGNNAGTDNSLGQTSNSGNPFGNNAGTDNSPIITDNGRGMKVYQNEAYGLELTFPSNWTASSPKDTVVKQIFFNPVYIQGFYPTLQNLNAHEAILTLFFLPDTTHSVSSLGSELYNVALDWVKEGGEIIKAEIDKIGGSDGGRIAFITTETDNDAPIVVDLFWVKYQDKGFLCFAFISQSDNGIKFLPEAKNIIHSIKINPASNSLEQNPNGPISSDLNPLPT